MALPVCQAGVSLPPRAFRGGLERHGLAASGQKRAPSVSRLASVRDADADAGVPARWRRRDEPRCRCSRPPSGARGAVAGGAVPVWVRRQADQEAARGRGPHQCVSGVSLNRRATQPWFVGRELVGSPPATSVSLTIAAALLANGKVDDGGGLAAPLLA